MVFRLAEALETECARRHFAAIDARDNVWAIMSCKIPCAEFDIQALIV